MGLRERKREQNRRTMLLTAYRLFSEIGYEVTTVERIAEESNVAPRTFYRHFDTKDAVLAEGGLEVVDRALEGLGPRPPIEQLTACLAAAVDELIHLDHFEYTIRLMRENPRIAERAPLWRQRWSSYLAGCLASIDGREQPTLDDHVRSTTAIGLVGLAIDEFVYRPDGSTVTVLADSATKRLRDALLDAAPDGRPHAAVER